MMFGFQRVSLWHGDSLEMRKHFVNISIVPLVFSSSCSGIYLIYENFTYRLTINQFPFIPYSRLQPLLNFC